MTRAALRSMVSPWVAVVALALYVALLATEGTAWRGDVEWTAGYPGTASVILVTLLAAATAFDTARASTPERLHLIQLSAARPWRFVIVTAWVPTAVVYLAAWLGLMAMTLTSPHDSSATVGVVLHPLVHVAAFGFAAAIGSAVGRYLSPLPAGIAGALVAAALVLDPWRGRPGPMFVLLDLAGVSGSMVGYATSVSYAGTQVLTLLALAGVLALLPMQVRGGRARPTWAGGVAVVAVLVLALLPLGRPAQRYVEHEAVPTDCRGTDPVICGFQEQSRQLDAVEPVIREMVSAARAQGYRALAPRRVAPVLGQQQAHAPAPGELVYMVTFLDELRQYSVPDVTFVGGALIEPVHCPALFALEAPPEQYFVHAENVIGTWAEIAGQQPDWPYVGLSADEVAEVLDGFASCTW